MEAASKSDDAEYERWAGFRAVKSVVAFDCGADTKMQLARTMKVPADARCSSLTAGQTLTQIGGDDVGTHGAAAYDGLVASCAASRRVKVGDETKTVEVGCAAPALLKRPAYLRVKGWASASTPTSTR